MHALRLKITDYTTHSMSFFHVVFLHVSIDYTDVRNGHGNQFEREV